jgi:hypothetical protein
MTRFVVLSSLLTALVLPACSTRRCAPGEFPNDHLQACVVLPACDGGVVDERNECVLTQGSSAENDGLPMTVPPGSEMDGGGGALSSSAGGGGRRSIDGGGGATGGAGGIDPSAGADGSVGAAGGVAGSAAGKTSAQCGDHRRDPGETCDGDCATQCAAPSSCMQVRLIGSAAQCTAECQSSPITTCVGGDGCCPIGCMRAMDGDCSAKCGDGTLDPGEKCETGSSIKPCPTSCIDTDPCTDDMLVGAASSCSAECVHTRITTAQGGDECCPQGADATTDSDCTPKCGNGVREGNEKCDGDDCPRSCRGNIGVCMREMLVGSAVACSAVCLSMAVTSPANGDGCCPTGADSTTDSDCIPRCGNGVKEGSETCDGSCPTSCDDKNPCTADVLLGDASLCSAQCTHKAVGAQAERDGCCPDGADFSVDGDCPPPCSNDSDCKADQFCVRVTEGARKAGTCVPALCTGDPDCTGDRFCQQNACVPRRAGQCDRDRMCPVGLPCLSTHVCGT